MDNKIMDCEKKKCCVLKNGTDLTCLMADESFWQQAVLSLSKEEISASKEEISAENADKGQSRHADSVFCIYCKCDPCLTFRKLIILIQNESTAYNDLWKNLKKIICSNYVFVTEANPAEIINRKYEELQSESCGIRWFSDGSIDVKKNIHVSMGNYFSLSNEMTFIIVFNMLFTRDRHQLFELLCLQLTSVILAYREGIKEMTRCVDDNGDEFYKPEEFLNYIMNGYERITEIAETLTPLVIEMREHLQKFSLTWQVLNQCMFYRFLYVDVESRMADCILRLKDAVDTETYKSFVYRFIKFDEEMQQLGQVWEVALVALELYRKSTPEQVERVERISMIRQIIESLSALNIESHVETPLSPDWIVSSESDDVWLSVLSMLQRGKCCKCWACLMADGNTVPEICAIPDDDAPAESKSSEESYHMSWAVFKHFKDRTPYTQSRIRPELFCVFGEPPCKRTECQVATNLIVGSYPLSFAKFLLRTYEPLTPPDREKFLRVPSQSLIRKFCLKKGGAAAKEIMQEADEINHSFLLLNMFWDDDDIADPQLRSGLAAALAENFRVEVKLPPRHVIFSYFSALFHVADDIEMDVEWLEKISTANLFKRSAMMTLNELKITAEVSGDGGNALDLVQFSMKEVADKLSSISLTDDKKVLENEIKKPLVEALKLAASNKKLEAELKSLQKEHNMLKDMVKGLEQIHGSEKKEETKEHAAEPSDCVCYYCTLFGKNQDMNSRSTETRDRLRKRLHHLQSQNKTKNLKNISLLLKNGPTPTQPPPPVVAATPAPKPPPAMKMKVELEVQQRKKKPQPVTNGTKIQRATEINVKSLENLVEYIEGPSSRAVAELKKAEEVAAKKQQKKARQLEQKVRREVNLMVESLGKLNLELQDVVVEMKQVQNQLSQLRSSKGKNKKLKTVEDKMGELERLRMKLEAEAKGIVGGIKEISPNVDVAKECGEMKALLKLLGVAAPPPPPVIHPVIQPQPAQVKKPIDDDPAKRMVTIRRINLPHAEPQVTVTAKGNTPDMDQLLYTFVNGQLVPASSLSPSAFQNGAIQLFMKSGGQTKMVSGGASSPQQLQVKQQQQMLQKPTPNPPQPEKSKKKTVVTPPPVQTAEKSVKKDAKKKKPEVKKSEVKEKPKVEPKNKVKKIYIDPEFAANPFKLLDDDEEHTEEEDEPEVVKPVKTVPEVVVEKKVEKSKKKKEARKDSVTSVSSSNASKESKKPPVVQEKKPQQPVAPKQVMQTMQMNGSSNSIMDQLNRGVRVEGLRLPPGITLTKVSPSEVVGSKRESINRIAQPMQDYSKAPTMPHKEQNGIIMVETAPHAEQQSATASKKKNKKKKAKNDENRGQATAERMVTLKNPMFFNNPSEPMNSMMRNIQTPPFVSPMTEPPTASIIRNENGMYTIRNPTFQNAFTSGGGNSSPGFTPRPQMEPIGRPYAGFQDAEPPKCSSVIGSEMKNVLQRRKEQEFAANLQYGMRQPAAYSHFGGAGVNFNNNGTHCDEGGYANGGGFPYYDDLRLQPGGHLNSEVTIHSVTESKMFQNQAKKTPPPIGTPRNGNCATVESVGTLFGDLLISRPIPSQENLMNGGDWINPKQNSNSNSNSPISVTSLDEIFESGGVESKKAFYGHHFSDDKSSGASSLFSSGM